MPGKIKKHLECKCFFLCQRRNFVENSLNRGIFTSSDTIYQFGNDIVSEKYSVARKSDFVAVRFEISLVGKSGKLFAVADANIAKTEIHIVHPLLPSLVRSRYKKNGAPIKERIMLTGTSPGGRITLPTVSHMQTRENPSSAEAGKRYL